jgi:hypothetical protein
VQPIKDIWHQASSPKQAAAARAQTQNHKLSTNTLPPSNDRRILVHVHGRRDTARILKTHRNTQLTSVTTQIAAMLGVAGMQPRQLAAQVLNFALVLSTAFMLWKGLSVVSDSPSPIVVVLSGSMEPAFQRGDLLFLWNRGLDTQVGEIVVYNVKGKDIPIVHRVVRRYGGE